MSGPSRRASARIKGKQPVVYYKDYAGDDESDPAKEPSPVIANTSSDDGYDPAKEPSPVIANTPSDDGYDPVKDSSPEIPETPGNDDFSADDEIEVTIDRKRKMKGKANASMKKARGPAMPTKMERGSFMGSVPAVPESTVLRLIPSEKTKLLNKWVELLPTLSIKEAVTPSPLSAVMTHLTPLGDLPDQDGRKYKYDIKLVELDVNWDPAEDEEKGYTRLKTQELRDLIAKYNKKIKTWRIHVWNEALPKDQQKRFRLFPEFKRCETHMMRFWRRTNAKRLSKDPNATPLPVPVYPDDQICVGGPLDINVCPDASAASRVAAEACRLLNKCPLDVTDDEFPDEFESGGHQRATGIRSLIELMAMRKIEDNFDFTKIRNIFRSSVQDCGTYCVSPRPSFVSRVNGLSYKIHVPTFTTGDLSVYKGRWGHMDIYEWKYTEEAINALPEVPSWWGLRFTEPTETPPSPLIPVKTMLKLFDYICWKIFGYVGTRDAMFVASRSVVDNYKRNSVRHRSGPFKGKPLFVIGFSTGRIRFPTYVAATISGSLPRGKIRTNLSQAELALVLQSAYEVFMQGKGVLNAYTEFFVAAEELRMGKSLLSRATYCKCGSDIRQKENTAHFCMYCLKLEICSKMALTPNGRLVCLDHFKKNSFALEQYLKTSITVKALGSEQHSSIKLSLEERKAMASTLIKKYALPENRFRDVYNGERDGDMSHSPFTFSLDATFPVWESNGSFFVHHADNVALTTHFTNRLKGEDIPLVLPAASYAMETQGDGKYLSDIECLFDHYSMIRSIVPRDRDNRKRFASQQKPGWVNSYIKVIKKGVFDNRPFIYKKKWRTYDKVTSVWDDEDIARLNKICTEIEHDATINPKGLILPRSPQTGAPWLWNPEHMFTNHDWVYLSSVFSTRLMRLDIACDWRNDHDNECEDTLFLTCVVLWFLLDGGKDELLGLRMTPFLRHPLRFSIGRATHVEPGSIMVTGWESKHPTSLSEYHDSRRTIVTESWMTNRGKWKFPTDPASIEQMKDAIRGINRTCDHWDTFPPSRVPKPVIWPRYWNFPYWDREGDEGDENDADTEDDEEYESDFEDDDIPEDDKVLLPLEEGEMSDSDDDDDEAPAMTLTRLNENQKFLLSLTKHLPQELTDQFEDIVSNWRSVIKRSLPKEPTKPQSTSASDPESNNEERTNQFVHAMTLLTEDFDFRPYNEIKDIAELTLENWQGLDEHIDRVFTEEEIVSICLRLNGKGQVVYLPDKAAFIFRLKQ